MTQKELDAQYIAAGLPIPELSPDLEGIAKNMATQLSNDINLKIVENITSNSYINKSLLIKCSRSE